MAACTQWHRVVLRTFCTLQYLFSLNGRAMLNYSALNSNKTILSIMRSSPTMAITSKSVLSAIIKLVFTIIKRTPVTRHYHESLICNWGNMHSHDANLQVSVRLFCTCVKIMVVEIVWLQHTISSFFAALMSYQTSPYFHFFVAKWTHCGRVSFRSNKRQRKPLAVTLALQVCYSVYSSSQVDFTWPWVPDALPFSKIWWNRTTPKLWKNSNISKFYLPYKTRKNWLNFACKSLRLHWKMFLL